jgi:hypothetical protein
MLIITGFQSERLILRTRPRRSPSIIAQLVIERSVIAAEVDPGGGTGTEFRATGKSLDIFP